MIIPSPNLKLISLKWKAPKNENNGLNIGKLQFYSYFELINFDSETCPLDVAYTHGKDRIKSLLVGDTFI